MIHHCPHLVIEDFLTDDQLDRLQEYATTVSDEMKASQVTSLDRPDGRQDDAYRRSQVATDLEPVWDIFDAPLHGLLPALRSELDVAHFPLGSVERQLTVSRDGDFFRRHEDEHQPWTDGCRMLTFVYYFQRSDAAYEGGHLRLYATEDGPVGRQQSDEYVEIVPQPNSVVFFPADWHHEVTPVEDPTGTAERWTVNGWFRAADLGRPPIPPVTPTAATVIASRLVPAVADGWSLRPTPPVVEQLVRARWELGRDEVVEEAVDDGISIGGRRGHLPIGTIGDDVLRHLQPLHEQWAGCPLVPINAFGFRVFGRGQGLDLHVEHVSTHVVSSMLIVAADVEEPFAATFVDGARTHRIALDAGQMLFYEGARLPHGHPEPLVGETFVVVHLHYRPAEWDTVASELTREALRRGIIDGTGALTVAGATP